MTEPLEFTFLFAAPALWLVYSVLDGLFQMIVYLVGIRVCATNGIIDFLVLNLPAGIGRTRWPLYVLVGLVEIVVMYLVFRFLIVKMNLRPPGREDGEEVTDLAANAAAVKQQIRSGAAEKTAASANDAQTAAHIVEGLGGAENILNTDNCMTRLRVQVKDAALVKDKEWFQAHRLRRSCGKGQQHPDHLRPQSGKDACHRGQLPWPRRIRYPLLFIIQKHYNRRLAL